MTFLTFYSRHVSFMKWKGLWGIAELDGLFFSTWFPSSCERLIIELMSIEQRTERYERDKHSKFTWKSGAEGALGANLMLNGKFKHFNLML